MENRRKIWRKIVEYSSSFWCSYPFGLCVIILNWSSNRDYVLGKGWLCSSKKNWLRFWWKIGSVFAKQVRLWENESATDFRKISHRLWENQRTTLGKRATDFGKTSHRLWENQRPTLGKSATDFEKISHRIEKMSHQLWENQRPISRKSATELRKWATDFGKMSHPLRENEPPTTGKWATDYGKISHRLWEKMSHRFWGNELRRCMEIRNKSFPKISLNKVT